LHNSKQDYRWEREGKRSELSKATVSYEGDDSGVYIPARDLTPTAQPTRKQIGEAPPEDGAPIDPEILPPSPSKPITPDGLHANQYATRFGHAAGKHRMEGGKAREAPKRASLNYEDYEGDESGVLI
jgi:hypothetical protein